MKKTVFACFWIIVWGAAAAAQPAPNRAADVAAIVASLPPAVETEADDARRAVLFEIVRRLNRAGDCCWGVLVKTDQGNKVPADTIVWRPTMEHFDILSGTPPGTTQPASGTWGYSGVVSNGKWFWQAVPDAAPGPPPPPPPPPSSGCNVERVEQTLNGLDGVVRAAIARQLDMDARLGAIGKSLEEHRAEARKVRSRVEKILTNGKTWVGVGGVIGGWLLKHWSQPKETAAQ